MSTPQRPQRLSHDAVTSQTSPRTPAALKHSPRTPTGKLNANWEAEKENVDSERSVRTLDTTGDTHQEFLDEDEEIGDLEDVSPQQTEKSVQGAAYRANGGYDALKSFNGQMYKGMAVGGSHTWNYDPGVWKETKIEPDLWKIDYETLKKRAKAAPSGSGAPVGTEYHWLIVAHQYVKKIDANTYETHLAGSKYKLAHKNASSNSWSIPTVKVQRDREVELLDDAKRRVQGLPPVLTSEKVKVEKREKGQRKLDSLFSKTPTKTPTKNADVNEASNKRKRDLEDQAHSNEKRVKED